jgi:MATE family multidrug resistance protein
MFSSAMRYLPVDEGVALDFRSRSRLFTRTLEQDEPRNADHDGFKRCVDADRRRASVGSARSPWRSHLIEAPRGFGFLPLPSWCSGGVFCAFARTSPKYPESPDERMRTQMPALLMHLRNPALIPWISEARALMKVSLPLIAMQLSQFGLVTTDVIMVGALGEKPLAATSIGAVMFYIAWLSGYGPVMAVSPVVSHILGANPNDFANTRMAVRMGLWAVAIVSPPLIALLALSRPVLLALGQPEEVVDMAMPWISIVACGLPFTLGFGVLRNFASATGRQNEVLGISVATLLVNIALNYMLIYGKLGAPALGITGAAIATAASYAFAFFSMLGLLAFAPHFKSYRLLQDIRQPDWARLRELFRLGVPMGMSMIFESMLFNAATLMMGTFGATTLAAHQIAMNLAGLAFMIPLGIGLGATVRVGLAKGAGDAVAARRAGQTAIFCSAAVAILFTVIMFAIPGALVGIYLPAGEAEEVRRLAGQFLVFAAFFHLFDALQVTGQLALRGLKDADVPMWIAAVSYWFVGFAVAWVLAFWLGWQGVGVWTGLTASLAVAAAGMVWRFEWLSRAHCR